MQERREVEWFGVLAARSAYNEDLIAARDRLADSARAGDWPAVLRILDSDSGWAGANDWRISGTSWFGPLHQAAWLGAPEEVARALIDRGAWRSLRDAKGRRPVDIAGERGHRALIEVLEPEYDVLLADAGAAAMNRRLEDLVEEAAAQVVERGTQIRHLDVLCLAERNDKVWFPIPGMYGGFAIELVKGRLHVESWSRMASGSGRAWVITADRTTLIDEGFV